MHRLFALVVCLALSISMQAQHNRALLHKLDLQPVRFKQPVEVTLRMDSPVPGAEYRLVMEKALVASLDTLTWHSMLHHPDIYFAKLFSSSVPLDSLHRFPYKQVGPTTRGSGLYPFNNLRVNIEAIKRPPKGQFYWQREPTRSYQNWKVRKDPTDMGLSSQFNSLPGVDSVRVVYVLERKKAELGMRKPTERLR